MSVSNSSFGLVEAINTLERFEPYSKSVKTKKTKQKQKNIKKPSTTLIIGFAHEVTLRRVKESTIYFQCGSYFFFRSVAISIVINGGGDS